MKKLINMTLLATVSYFIGGCVLTDMAMAPAGSINGADLEAKLKVAASSGMLAGIAANPNAATMTTSAPTGISSASVTIGIQIVRTLNINSKEYYTVQSADKCEHAVLQSTFLAFAGGIEPPPLTAAAGSKEGCKLEKTGNIIHINDKIKL